MEGAVAPAHGHGESFQNSASEASTVMLDAFVATGGPDIRRKLQGVAGKLPAPVIRDDFSVSFMMPIRTIGPDAMSQGCRHSDVPIPKDEEQRYSVMLECS